MQKEGLDYTDTFAPVVRYDSLRMLLAHVALEDLETVTFDIKSAFLYGDLEEDIYMEVPKGVRVSTNGKECCMSDDDYHPSDDTCKYSSNVVCKLRRSLYGLKQAPRCWNTKFKEFLSSFSFYESEADKCIFIGECDGYKVYLALFVDDGLIICKSNIILNSILYELRKQFEITVGDSSYFVGLEIYRDRDKKSLVICQHAYTQHVIDRFRMNDANPICTPADTNLHLKMADSNTTNKCNAPYREAIGSLMYLAMTTRPDIPYIVCYLSRFQSGYDGSHWQALKRVLAYLKGTKYMGLEYKSNKEPCNLIGYSDSDYAGCLETRKSTTGYVFFMAGASVSWTSRRQELVTRSTTESEYVAAATAAREALWLKRLLNDLGYSCDSGILLHVDNQSAICLTKDSTNHRRTKHIDTRYHFLKERCEIGDISVTYVSSKNQRADVFTKVLPKCSFIEMRDNLGLVNVSFLFI